MKKAVDKSYLLASAMVGVLTVVISGGSVLAAVQPSIEDRLQRVERIIENPVLLQLSRRLGEQQREIQESQDDFDLLKRDLYKAKKVADMRYEETDDRLSALESAIEKLIDQNEKILEMLTPAIPKEAITTNLNIEGSVPVMTTEVNGVSLDDSPKKVQVASQAEAEQVSDEQTTVENQAGAEVELVLTPITTHPPTSEEQEAYQLAFSLIKNNQYDNAIKVFQSFLDSYPQSELASNAAYWMGEAFYIKQDHQAALNAFNSVIKRYPYSSKIADAMLRAGDCSDNLKQQDQAKVLYSELIKLYPDTRAAEKAIKRLEKLSNVSK